MDSDSGLARRLPQPPENEEVKQELKIKERNLMEVRLNAAGFLWVKDGIANGYVDISELRERAKTFIKNEQNLSNLPEKHTININLLGPCTLTDKHVISVQTDRGTPYEMYFMVQNELVAAYNELRDEKAKEKFGRLYEGLTDEQKVAIRTYYPQKISEAEPKNYGGN